MSMEYRIPVSLCPTLGQIDPGNTGGRAPRVNYFRVGANLDQSGDGIQLAHLKPAGRLANLLS